MYSEHAFPTQVDENIAFLFQVNRCAFQTNLAAGASSTPRENAILVTR